MVEAGGSQKDPNKRRARFPQSPPPSSPPKVAEVPLSMPHEEGEIYDEVDHKEEERVFRKAFLDMTDMVRVLYQKKK